MQNYRLSDEARNDLVRIWDWGEGRFGEAQADSYLNDMRDRFDFIAKNPEYYSVDIDHPIYRTSVCGRDTIYYRIANDGIVDIVRILGSQDRETALK